MSQSRLAVIASALTLLVACGNAGSAGTGGGGSGFGGSTGQGGDMPGGDASSDVGSAMDALPDPIKTCEPEDGNACTISPEAQGCQRCIQSCCCDRLATCRADTDCAAAIGRFNDCIQQGNMGVACLVVAVETLPDAALFASVAECVSDECGDLTCRL